MIKMEFGVFWRYSLFLICVLVAVQVACEPLVDDTQNIEVVTEILNENSTLFNETKIAIGSASPVSKVSKATMDIITVIWYLSTFLALAAFFFLMACSDRRCNRSAMQNQDQAIPPPPTPAPSYSEFAPPSYESVIKQATAAGGIFVVPVDHKIPDNKTTTTAGFQYYTINELQKIV